MAILNGHRHTVVPHTVNVKLAMKEFNVPRVHHGNVDAVHIC